MAFSLQQPAPATLARLRTAVEHGLPIPPHRIMGGTKATGE
jgi:hypothetical protein